MNKHWSLTLKQTTGNSEIQVPSCREIIVWWQVRVKWKPLTLYPLHLWVQASRIHLLACMASPPCPPPVYLISSENIPFKQM